MSEAFDEDVSLLKNLLSIIPLEWDGKESIATLKEAEYNWRQMEWWAFYFEHLCHIALKGVFTIPGDRFGNVGFDLKRSVNWDLKSKAVKSDDHHAILNDKEAMQLSIEKYGEHGVVVALCDVEYNDVDRTFQKWHSDLKGGQSRYERDREVRTNVSRYRKTRASLTELLILKFVEDDLDKLGTMKQGRNSNGKPRREKYMLDLEDLDNLLVARIVLKPLDISTGLA